MKKIGTLLILFFLNAAVDAQLKEVEELRIIGEKYDSILIAYQKKAKDSLSSLKKSERNEIMANHEAKIIEKRKLEEFAQLKKIKQKEQELAKLNVPDKGVKCNTEIPFQMPDLKRKTKYKPTINKTNKDSLKQDDRELKSILVFNVTGSGYIKNIQATGDNDDFNKELEITLYKIERFPPRCYGGIAFTQRYKLPVIMKFDNQ